MPVTQVVASADRLLELLADRAEQSVAGRDEERAVLLVADALSGCLAARELIPAEPYAADGVAGRVALLARRMSAQDLDDVDWTSMHHPGSVVLPVVLALGSQDRAPAIGRAVASGYRVAATMADLLGAEHRRGWHVTATAGAVGAASAASVMLGATPRQHAGSLALAAANVGGIGQAPLERAGAASFNRAAAACLGLLAARSAIAGTPWTREPLSGSRGLLALTSAGVDVRTPEMREGIRDAAPRIFPVTGFAQSAVIATADLRSRATDPLISLEVTVTPSAAAMADGSAGGDWWNLRLAVARAWALGDPFAVGDTRSGDAFVDRVSITSGPLASGSASAEATTGNGRLVSGVVHAPSLDPSGADSLALLHGKWSLVLNQDPASVMEMARQFLATGSLDADRILR